MVFLLVKSKAVLVISMMAALSIMNLIQKQPLQYGLETSQTAAMLGSSEHINKTANVLKGIPLKTLQKVAKNSLIEERIKAKNIGRKPSSVHPSELYKYVTQTQVKTDLLKRFALIDNFQDANADACKGKGEVSLVIWVHSAIDNFERRNRIREFWGNKENFKGKGMNVVVLFAIGRQSLHYKALEVECQTYGDCVRLNVLDKYHHLTYKAVGGMRWVHKYCPQAPLFLKIDDDTMLIPDRLVPWLQSIKVANQFPKHTIFALMNMIHRKREDSVGKWQISEYEWPLKYFADEAAPGLAYFITTDLFPSYFLAMESTPWIWLEDVWITGSLVESIRREGRVANVVNLNNSAIHDFSTIDKQIKTKTLPNNTFIIGQMPLGTPSYQSVLDMVDLEVL